MSENDQQQPVRVNQTPRSSELSEEDRSFSQDETIAILQEAIYQLEGILKKLNAEPERYSLPVASFQTLIASTEELIASTQMPQTTISVLEETEIEEESEAIPFTRETEIEEESEAIPFTREKAPTRETLETAPAGEVIQKSAPVRETEPVLRSQPSWWGATLEKIRSFLPESWNEKLSDTALTGIVSGIVGVLLFTFVLGLPQKSTKELVQAPSVAVETPSEIQTDRALAPEVGTPSEITTDRELEAEIVAPPIEPKLTPEQSLIVAIENQVTAALERYTDELVLSIQPNFQDSLCVVQLDDKWYDLSESNQDELANKILFNAQELDFHKIKLTDSQGTLLARSPVIGKDLVVFQRHK